MSRARANSDSLPRPGERHRFFVNLVEQACAQGLRIADGEEADIPQGETTVTETVLLNLHKRLGGRLRIEKLNQAQEGVLGADWIWCVGDENAWFSFYVQAKKLKENGYDIGYRTDGHHLRQLDKLLRTSLAGGVMPVYVLYNPASDHVPYSRRQCARNLPHPADSITCVSALAAGSLLTARRPRTVRIQDMSPHAHPWSCLAWCPDEPDGWLRAIGDDPRGPRPFSGLPGAFLRRSVPGTMARLAASPRVDVSGRVEPVPGLESVGELVRDLVRGSFSVEPPLWATSPHDAIEPWRSRLREFADDYSGDANDIGLRIPSVVVTQQFSTSE